MTAEQNPDVTLQQLVDQIDRAGLRAPVGLMLDLISPLDIISSQMALLIRPLLGGSSWQIYAVTLAEAPNWQVFRRLIGR